MSGVDVPPRSARAQIASAINVVIQVARLSDGRRKLVSVSELTGMEGEVITMQEIFRFRQTGLSGDGVVQGRFEAAHTGTLFIDEIGDFALSSQAKLLRVLENHVVTPVGSNDDKQVDVRAIAVLGGLVQGGEAALLAGAYLSAVGQKLLAHV